MAPFCRNKGKSCRERTHRRAEHSTLRRDRKTRKQRSRSNNPLSSARSLPRAYTRRSIIRCERSGSPTTISHLKLALSAEEPLCVSLFVCPLQLLSESLPPQWTFHHGHTQLVNMCCATERQQASTTHASQKRQGEEVACQVGSTVGVLLLHEFAISPHKQPSFRIDAAQAEHFESPMCKCFN